MNKTVVKIFSCFILCAAVIATILLCVNFTGIAFIGSDTNYIFSKTPRRILDAVERGLNRTESGYSLADEAALPADSWCILIDSGGRVVWEQNRPEDVPTAYSLNDVARMTRWFLNDYPVYVRTLDDGLLVLGYPKNSLGKYSVEYSMSWFDTLPQRVLLILLINLCLAALLACLFGAQLYRRMKLLAAGLKSLRQEKAVHLKETGIFRELSRDINDASAAIERKNEALAARDAARSNWVAGISHDIRTPLSMVMGYAESLADSPALSEENRKKAEIITAHSVKIKQLIEDLNLISSLEYDMQPARKNSVRLCPLLRRIVSDVLNSGLPEGFAIELDLQYEKAVVLGDEALLERAFFNLINNSVAHNANGCNIAITERRAGEAVQVVLADDGKGVSAEVLENLGTLPKSAHGLGLPMACKIIRVHGGTFTARNMGGFRVEITLPLD